MTTSKQPTNPSLPVCRTSAGLRDALFDELDALRNGTSNPTRSNAVAKLAAGVVETVRMEVEVQKHLRSAGANVAAAPAAATPAWGAPLTLGG